MQSANTVILIEDDAQIRQFIQSSLEREGWRVFEAETGQRGLMEAGNRKPDLLLVDLGLPDMDGIDVIREFRNWSTIPILILSARSDELEKIKALDAGADDYLTKPFGIGELLARVRAVTRRRISESNDRPNFNFGDVEVDLSKHLAMRSGQVVHLTKLEYRLLAVLLANSGKILSQRKLMQEVWGPNQTENAHYLRIYMSHLRQKLEVDPAQPVHFMTETGIGYRFEL